jgi:hypothetical protein
MQDTFISRIAEIVGASNVLTADSDTAPYTTDWRKQYRGAALAVVRPASTAEVSAVVRRCAEAAIAIVPQGGNTGLSGGSVPTGKKHEIVLSLRRMNRIRQIDPLNDTLTAEAGCVLADIQRAASDAGRLFALSLAAEGSCQIGGNLSTNAGGVNVLRYGNARDQVLGPKRCLPDGRIWDGCAACARDNTGYDLKQLFIGAEGHARHHHWPRCSSSPEPSASATLDSSGEPAASGGAVESLRTACGDRLRHSNCFRAPASTPCSAIARNARPAPGSAWRCSCRLATAGQQRRLRS